MSAVPGLTVEAYFPDRELASQVESFLIVRSERGAIRTLPPNTAPVLVFRLEGTTTELVSDGETAIPRIGLTGLNRSPRVIRYHRHSAMLLVRFREGGAAGIVSAPMDELTGRSSGLDSLTDPHVVREVEDRLHEARGDAERIAVVQNFLKSRSPERSVDRLIEEAIRRIRHSRGNIGIGELVYGLATNPDTLEKKFRHVVGATPKLFSRMVKFQSFLHDYSTPANL
ncbi:MAG TPA: DUF6597 domain-containing transcriptional factor, partial [Spirochaetia bacterium]|nr:DUF6597 domain-containing transcriptional factor [Spirochaetia bacterium]